MRRSRAAAENIIPTETHSPRVVGTILPQLAGKLDGMALNVPVPDGSNVDLVTLMKRPVTAEEVNEIVKSASLTTFKGIVEYTEQPTGTTVVEADWRSSKGTRLRAGDDVFPNQIRKEELARGDVLGQIIDTPQKAPAAGLPYPYAGFNCTGTHTLQPFPHLKNNAVTAWGDPVGFSNYHAGNLVITKRFSKGVTAYGAYTFNDAESGTTLITIKKATETDHGPSTGWLSSYGVGQATFGALQFQNSYYLIDGATGGGPSNWTNGFGIYIFDQVTASCF